jgi:hypothetical protein
VGAALVSFAIVAPWLVWLPLVTAPATVILLGAVAIVCALHGWGRIVARLSARSDVDAALAMQWGVAAILAVSGIMIALQIYDARLLLVVGCGAHTADVAVRFPAVREHVAGWLSWGRVRYWIFPIGLLALVGVIGILGAAGQVTNRAFDDESNVIAQVQRLAATGGLTDAIGFPRTSQLGGHVSLGALATTFGDARLARILDRGIGLVMFLLLACSRARPRDAESAIWPSLVVVLAASFRLATPDLLPLWIPAGLVLALHATLGSTRPAARSLIPVGLLAGALCAVRLELVPFALAALVVAWWAARTPAPRDWRRPAALLGGTLIVVLGYWFARSNAWSHVAGSAPALLAVKAWSLPLRLVLFVAIAAATVPLAILVTRELDDPAVRSFAIMACIAIAGVTSRRGGVPPQAKQLLWAVAMAGIVVAGAALSSRQALTRAAMIVALLACILVVDARSEPGRRAWAWRAYDQMFDVQYARHIAAQGGGYGALVARVPAGERLAVWVARPELLDYSRNEIVDLRSPRVARVTRLDKVLAATRARWLLVEVDSDTRPAAIVAAAHPVASMAGVQLVQLR